MTKDGSMIAMMMERHWENVRRGHFDRCGEVHCPDCGAVSDGPVGPPAVDKRYVTLTCVDHDCRAKFDVIRIENAGWLIRLRKARVWQDFSEEFDWEESGGIGSPL